MDIVTEYIVMTCRLYCWDIGSWASFADKSDAKRYMKDLGGSMWKKITKNGVSTMKEIKP